MKDEELTRAQVGRQVCGLISREEGLIRVPHEAPDVHCAAVGIGRAQVNVARSYLQALRAAARPDRLHTLRHGVHAGARGHRNEPREARHSDREVADQRLHRAVESAAGHGGAVADLPVARARGFVEERQALVPYDAAVEDGAPAGGGAAGGVDARGAPRRRRSRRRSLSR